jgi:4-diphosphocytidyl-2-C-methyl-D-erythritol kinase
LIHTRASFAKINLFLHVTGRRPNGFHDLFSVMTKITLKDDMEFTFHGDGIEVTCDHPMVPENETNLAHRAAVLFFAACKNKGKPLPLDGVAIHIQKKIPVGGGLGGGSSNAATVLKVLNARCNDLFSVAELMKLGNSLGADVPFFLFGGPALATGTGDTLDRVPDVIPRYLVLCDPGVHVPTARVFENHDFRLTSLQKYIIKSASNVLLQGQEIDIRQYVHNDLEGSAFKLYPEIRSTKEEMERVLQRPVTMSGSGGSLFALFSKQKTAAQGYEALCRRWAGGGKKCFLTALQNG